MAGWNDRKTSKYVGQKVTRVDGPAKATGRAKYTFDIVLPGMLYGVMLRSPHASAKITKLDTSAAEKMPGVKAVVTIAGVNSTLRYHGQEIAAVAAVTEELAKDAVRAIVVEYEKQPHSVRTEMAAKIADRKDAQPSMIPEGEVADALKSAAATIEATYSVPIRLHTSLESHGSVCKWDGDALTTWCSTQAVHGVKEGMAANQGIAQDKSHVICEYMGGGFGSKFGPGVEGSVCATLAKKAGAPVKLMCDRAGEQLATGNGPDGFAEVKAGASADGKLTVVKANLFGTGGNSSRWGLEYPYIYHAEKRDVSMTGVRVNCGSQAALRAPMHPQACALTEMMIDELAYKLNMDPVEFRLKNQSSQLREAQFRMGAQMIGWDKRNMSPGKSKARFVRGMGVATGKWGGGGGPGSQVQVVVNSDGTVLSKVGTQDLGTGTRTYVASIVAEDLGIDIDRVKAMIGDSALGYSGGSGGSTTTASLAPAVKTAAQAARAQLFAKAAEMLSTTPDSLDARDNKVFVAADPSKSVKFTELCARLGAQPIVANGQFDGSLQQGGVAGVQFAEVEVDMWTGHVQPIKVVAVQDCGYAINRLAAESQLIGGVIQGIAMALFEGRKMDEHTGRCLNPDMENYKLPGPMEMPEIIPVIYDTHDKVAGIGEPAVIPTAGAVANAVYNASGLRIRHLPIVPKRMMEAMA